MSRPISRILSWKARGDHPSGMRIAAHLGATHPPTMDEQPIGAGPKAFLGLAPGGVYLAATVTRRAGELLPHRFTLTRTPKGRWRSVLCGTVPHVAVGGR